MNKTEIANAIIEGFFKGKQLRFDVYDLPEQESKKIAKQSGVARANEQLLSSSIVGSLYHKIYHDELREFATHETAGHTVEAAIAKRVGGAVEALRNRYDIVLWKDQPPKSHPYCLIEVKDLGNSVTSEKISTDVKKLCHAMQDGGLQNNGKLKHAFFAASITSTVDNVKRTVAKIKEESNAVAMPYLKKGKEPTIISNSIKWHPLKTDKNRMLNIVLVRITKDLIR